MLAKLEDGLPDSRTNRLLDALPGEARRRAFACGKVVSLRANELLCAAGQHVSHVYFPLTALITVTTPIQEHRSLADGLVGDEGMLGAWSLLGVRTAPVEAGVQNPGDAWALQIAPFRRELDSSPALRKRLSLYLFVDLSQRARTTACVCFHVLEQRLARWLLMTRDRTHCETFHLTHEYLAGVLGVRRAGITTAALSLQAAKLIRYTRGEIQILDSRGLAAASCSCYAADRRLYGEILK